MNLDHLVNFLYRENTMISYSSLILLVSFIVLLINFLPKSKPQKGLPPSPPKLPVLGNLHQLGFLPHRSLQALSKRYGPLMYLHLGSFPTLIASSADASREIMKNQDMIFASRPKMSKTVDVLFYDCKDIAFAPYGEHWRQVRSICVLHLLSNKRVQSFRHVRDEETSLTMEKIRNSSSSSIDLSELMVSLTCDVISRVALGRKYDDVEGSENVGSMLKELGEIVGAFNPGDYIPWLNWIKRVNGFNVRLNKSAKWFDSFFERVVEEHRNGKNQAEGKTDLVDILIDVQRESTTGTSIDTETIKSLIFDMFSAGTHTIFASMEWTMSELIKHPKTMEKLKNEARQVAGSKYSEITEDDLEKMPYLKAVLKESLRLHHPVPLLLPRVATQDTKVMGYNVAAGTRVLINGWAIGRDPTLWENPEEFNPERFMNSNVDFKGLHFELTPFGAGRRGCPGITFATTLDELTLARMVHKFDFEAQEDLDMSELPGTTILRKFPLVVKATPWSG